MPVVTNGYTTLEVSDQQIQVYNALNTAVYKIGLNTYKRLKNKKHYCTTQEQDELVKTMSLVLSGELDCESAMALLHQYDTFKQRT